MEWTKVGRTEEFGPGFHLRGQGRARFVLAIIDNELFAFDPSCPHAGGPLHLAETEGAVIACPLHCWRFDLKQQGRELHGYRDLTTYEVRVDDGTIYVKLPQLPNAKASIAIKTDEKESSVQSQQAD